MPREGRGGSFESQELRLVLYGRFELRELRPFLPRLPFDPDFQEIRHLLQSRRRQADEFGDAVEFTTQAFRLGEEVGVEGGFVSPGRSVSMSFPKLPKERSLQTPKAVSGMLLARASSTTWTMFSTPFSYSEEHRQLVEFAGVVADGRVRSRQKGGLGPVLVDDFDDRGQAKTEGEFLYQPARDTVNGAELAPSKRMAFLRRRRVIRGDRAPAPAIRRPP